MEGVSEDGAWGQVTRQRNGRVIWKWITTILLAVVTDSKRQCRYCLIELTILLTRFMKEYFNSFDEFNFFIHFHQYLEIYMLLAKTTAVQNEDALSHLRVRGLYFLAVVFAANIDSNAKRNTPLYSEFLLYKMIYFSSHKFVFSNLHFSPWARSDYVHTYDLF